ncbi:MAG: class I SAM-dependent methyltransferase [Cellvibrionales bacterium]|nr:class I SAM-dependent methyltransferase [Cellvibrionales bacterium]
MTETYQRYLNDWHTGKRSEIINRLIKENNYQKYLEIGVFKSKDNFDKIQIQYKIGVDPGRERFKEATHTMTSDDYFDMSNEKFDIVFVDGLHHHEQVYKDIINSLNVLNTGGVVVCHDMNPQQYEHQLVPQYEKHTWNGDCWKAYVQLRMTRDDLKMCVIDADFGLGVIRKGVQKKIKTVDLTYANLNQNRNMWLNLISENDFFKT